MPVMARAFEKAIFGHVLAETRFPRSRHARSVGVTEGIKTMSIRVTSKWFGMVAMVLVLMTGILLGDTFAQDLDKKSKKLELTAAGLPVLSAIA